MNVCEPGLIWNKSLPDLPLSWPKQFWEKFPKQSGVVNRLKNENEKG